jgi:hypothetical protein
MITLRTYSNPAEAAMAKSRLDDRNISCALADENVNLYGGGPLAMPIRLLVAEEQAEEAARILERKGSELPEDFDPGTAIEAQTKISATKFFRNCADFVIRTNRFCFLTSSSW